LTVPKFPKQEEFKGEVIHAFEYKTAKKYVGKKVTVVGAATSGHDVAHDLANHGVDVVSVLVCNDTFIRI